MPKLDDILVNWAQLCQLCLCVLLYCECKSHPNLPAAPQRGLTLGAALHHGDRVKAIMDATERDFFLLCDVGNVKLQMAQTEKNTSYLIVFSSL